MTYIFYIFAHRGKENEKRAKKAPRNKGRISRDRTHGAFLSVKKVVIM